MQYKIEVIYAHGWNDAEWTEETDGETRPLRFEAIPSAQAALDGFFGNVNAAVDAGNMEAEENRNNYRIVKVAE
jgi:hypothetical protein